MCVRLVFVAVIFLTLHIIQADPDKMVFKILKSRDNQLLCDRTLDNLKFNQVTVKEGGPMKIDIRFRNFIDYIECSDYTNSSRIFVNKSGLSPINQYHKFEVPQVTRAMNATWNCRILALRDIKGLRSPMVNFNGSKYAAFNCSIQVNVLPADLFALADYDMPAELDICQNEKDEIATLRIQNAIFNNLLKDCCHRVNEDILTCSAGCFEKEPENLQYKYAYPSYT